MSGKGIGCLPTPCQWRIGRFVINSILRMSRFVTNLMLGTGRFLHDTMFRLFINSMFRVQGRIQGIHEIPQQFSRLPPQLETIWFFGVKSWFFTRNTPNIFAPPSARRNFFKCAPSPFPPNLKTWIRPWSRHRFQQYRNYLAFWGDKSMTVKINDMK